VKLEQSFEVAAPLERVWQALIDVEQVAPCLPGASVTGRNDDGSYTGSLTIKIGPTTAAYAGKLEMEQIDEGSYSAVMQAQGTDKRGQGGAKATISSKLTEIDGGTKVDVVTDYHITGRLARFGRGGMIEDISERLLKEFAQSLQASLTSEPAAPGAAEAPAEDGAPAPEGNDATAGAAQPEAEPAPPQEAQPLDAVPLVASVMRARAKENPTPLIALVVGFLLAIVIFRRRGRHSG
jgi:carbon monoxide dehydrogenase subunit G